MSMISRDVIERFAAKVDKRSPDDCWPWKASISKNGYGSFKFNGAAVTSSRMAWAIAHGQDAGAAMVLHTCDNPPCCNPAHLYLGDVKRGLSP